MTRANIVGSGPNGLAAAVVLAKAGVEVTVFEATEQLGGGAQSTRLADGTLQDDCAAVHPMVIGSEFLQELDLASHGVHWKHADIDCAHPLDDGDAVLLHQSIQRTADGLGQDGRRWLRAFGSPSRHFDDLAADIMRPLLRFPSHPFRLARFGLVAGPPPTWTSRYFSTERARTLFLGVAAHAFTDLRQPLVGGIGAGIITAGHAGGWPVIEGGTGELTRALVEILRAHGATFELGSLVTSHRALPPAEITIYDVHPRGAMQILENTLPARVRAAYTTFKPGPAAFKVAFTIDGPVPWRDPHVGRAGTVHLTGAPAETIQAERDIVAGRMPDRPFVLVGQQFVADPSRSSGALNPLYAYAHVPSGYDGDATGAIVAQIERFAPGFRDTVVEMRSFTPGYFAEHNRNFVRGDILTGAKTPLQFMLGPRLTAHPYDTGVPGVYICSAATPPGPGVHGMSGYHAAKRALAEHARRRE